MFGVTVGERQKDQRSLNGLVALRLLYRWVKTIENWRLVSKRANDL